MLIIGLDLHACQVSGPWVVYKKIQKIDLHAHCNQTVVVSPICTMYHTMVLFQNFFGALARSGEHCNRCSGAAVMNLDQLCIEQYHAPRIYFEKNACVCH